jgi:hypothetical protein
LDGIKPPVKVGVDGEVEEYFRYELPDGKAGKGALPGDLVRKEPLKRKAESPVGTPPTYAEVVASGKPAQLVPRPSPALKVKPTETHTVKTDAETDLIDITDPPARDSLLEPLIQFSCKTPPKTIMSAIPRSLTPSWSSPTKVSTPSQDASNPAKRMRYSPSPMKRSNHQTPIAKKITVATPTSTHTYSINSTSTASTASTTPISTTSLKDPRIKQLHADPAHAEPHHFEPANTAVKPGFKSRTTSVSLVPNSTTQAHSNGLMHPQANGKKAESNHPDIIDLTDDPEIDTIMSDLVELAKATKGQVAPKGEWSAEPAGLLI